MLFASVEYLIFLPIVVCLYWAIPSRHRNLMLLLASYVFYMAFIPAYGLLIFGLAIANYLFGLIIERSRRPGGVLVVALGVDLAVLIFFKYTNFLVGTAGALLRTADWPTINIVLPLGISFFTFEFIHYLVDVRKGSIPIHSFTDFHLFASFFPSQIAGPIKRFQPFVAQLAGGPRFDGPLFEEGCWLITRGLAKKLLFADHLAPIAAAAFAPGVLPDAGSAWVGIYAFGFQIYFDFSGYTDIGRGSAQLLGFQLPENFIQPYFSTGLRDFWRRWHVSLSTWLRDYLYIPLGGNRQGRVRTSVNLLVTMTLGGLWHGAGLHFAVWGAAHGAGLVLEHAVDGTALGRPGRLTRIVIAFVTFQFVTVAWVLFRAPGVTAASRYLGAMLGVGGTTVIPAGPVALVIAIYALAVVIERLAPGAFGPRVAPGWWLPRAAAYAGLATGTIVFLPQTIERFIYFQF